MATITAPTWVWTVRLADTSLPEGPGPDSDPHTISPTPSTSTATTATQKYVMSSDALPTLLDELDMADDPTASTPRALVSVTGSSGIRLAVVSAGRRRFRES